MIDMYITAKEVLDKAYSVGLTHSRGTSREVVVLYLSLNMKARY